MQTHTIENAEEYNVTAQAMIRCVEMAVTAACEDPDEAAAITCMLRIIANRLDVMRKRE